MLYLFFGKKGDPQNGKNFSFGRKIVFGDQLFDLPNVATNHLDQRMRAPRNAFGVITGSELITNPPLTGRELFFESVHIQFQINAVEFRKFAPMRVVK